MASELMDEHEQGERVRAWLRENGAAIVTGVAIGLAGLFGWQWWSQAQVQKRYDAAAQYEALQDAVERNDRDAVDALASSLVSDFGNTSYAALALLQQAERELDAGQMAAARDTLEQALGQSRNAAITDLARVRLARVLIALEDPAAALQRLDAVAGSGYVAVVAELRGDALQALGRRDEARAAYADAVESLDAFSPGRRLVEMKLVDAGGTPPPSLES
jgi:predicted negative regulator of RcsB-dependent stress response